MIRNGRPGAPDPGQYSLSEFKPIDCPICKERRRLPVRWVVLIQHRFKPTAVGQIMKEAYICLGCGYQLSTNGEVVKSDDEDYLTKRDLYRLGVHDFAGSDRAPEEFLGGDA